MERHTDLCRLDNGTLTAIRYRAEILVPIVRRNWYHWMATTLAWPKSNRSPLGHYVLFHLAGCTSDCPGAQWCPGPDLWGNNLDTIRRLIKSMRWCCQASMWGPYKLLSTVLSCCNEISAKLTSLLHNFSLRFSGCLWIQPSVGW